MWQAIDLISQKFDHSLSHQIGLIKLLLRILPHDADDGAAHNSRILCSASPQSIGRTLRTSSSFHGVYERACAISGPACIGTVAASTALERFPRALAMTLPILLRAICLMWLGLLPDGPAPLVHRMRRQTAITSSALTWNGCALANWS